MIGSDREDEEGGQEAEGREMLIDSNHQKLSQAGDVDMLMYGRWWEEGQEDRMGQRTEDDLVVKRSQSPCIVGSDHEDRVVDVDDTLVALESSSWKHLGSDSGGEDDGEKGEKDEDEEKSEDKTLIAPRSPTWSEVGSDSGNDSDHEEDDGDSDWDMLSDLVVSRSDSPDVIGSDQQDSDDNDIALQKRGTTRRLDRPRDRRTKSGYRKPMVLQRGRVMNRELSPPKGAQPVSKEHGRDNQPSSDSEQTVGPSDEELEGTNEDLEAIRGVLSEQEAIGSDSSDEDGQHDANRQPSVSSEGSLDSSWSCGNRIVNDFYREYKNNMRVGPHLN
ncbi:hypothetical protein EST38_g14351 [Candolleomyces aberdarensis]|uniref:Uncharacterized protein n=1 Tax=Candolleomyces aberdarensis TaxID=2316362 RepID=A0A4Q2CZC0_9AGAR|nr:hypothetical protein EST38_g14351 [Candolleomyces aberdarensis]